MNGEQTIKGAANGGDLTVPKITTREILTTVTIPNNETIVLGGLITARNSDSVSGIPLLSSIPYLGRLFGNTTKKNERAELLVFLQPSIIRNRNSLDSVQSAMDERYKVSKDTRGFADGPTGLPPVEQAPPPVANKGGAPKATPVKTASGTSQATSGKMKKSIRPTHRE